jgi:hypothetical protein
MLTIFQQSQGPIERRPDTAALDPKLLLQSPIPRALKMGWPIKLEIAVYAIFAAGILAWWASGLTKLDKSLDFAERLVPVLAFFILITVVSARAIQEMRNRQLLQCGNCVQGRVVDRIRVGGGKQSKTMIVYKFAVGPGKPMTVKVEGYSGSCSVNSPVLVFYDPDRLERNVTLCSTGWRVCDENGRLIEP